jgi:ParB-like chromosome segregation protein Spo0J
VTAIIESVDDQSLVLQMVHENLARKDSSPYERAEHMRRTLDLKVFVSPEKLADATGLDRSSVYKLLKLANLPEEVVAAFRSPAHIQVNFGARLEAALDRDRDGVLERAREIASEGTPTDPKLVVEKLAPQSLHRSQAPQAERIRIELDGNLWALITVPAPASGEMTTVAFEQGAIETSALHKALLKLSGQRTATSRTNAELKTSA